MLYVTQIINNLHATKGGPSRTVMQLSLALRARPDTRVSIVCAQPESVPSPNTNAGEPSENSVLIQASGNIYRALRQLNGKDRTNAIVHDNGLWRISNLLAAVSAKRLALPYVISPHGMLESWALQHHGRRKQIALAAYQRWCLRHAVGFHATCFKEAESIRRLNLRQPIAVIGNGIEAAPAIRAREPAASRIALFLSRLHPVKGASELVEAWSIVRPAGWILRIVGPDEGGQKRKLQQAIDGYGLANVVELVGEVDDKEKWVHYRHSQLFILPTHTENFGLVIGEALAAGLPVITTTETPWNEIASRGCGWIIQPTVDELVKALRIASQLPPETLASMGKIGEQWIPHEFSWTKLSEHMREYYQWLLNGSLTNARPSFVV